MTNKQAEKRKDQRIHVGKAETFVIEMVQSARKEFVMTIDMNVAMSCDVSSGEEWQVRIPWNSRHGMQLHRNRNHLRSPFNAIDEQDGTVHLECRSDIRETDRH